MFYSTLKVLSNWRFFSNRVDKLWKICVVLNAHLEHESTLINTNRILFGAGFFCLSQSRRTDACALAVDSGGKNKFKIPEPTARGESRRLKLKAGTKCMRWHQRAAASGDKPEKKPCIGTRFVLISVDSCSIDYGQIQNKKKTFSISNKPNLFF
jgi:hypothetical protein